MATSWNHCACYCEQTETGPHSGGTCMMSPVKDFSLSSMSGLVMCSEGGRGRQAWHLDDQMLNCEKISSFYQILSPGPPSQWHQACRLLFPVLPQQHISKNTKIPPGSNLMSEITLKSFVYECFHPQIKPTEDTILTPQEIEELININATGFLWCSWRCFTSIPGTFLNLKLASRPTDLEHEPVCNWSLMWQRETQEIRM